MLKLDDRWKNRLASATVLYWSYERGVSAYKNKFIDTHFCLNVEETTSHRCFNSCYPRASLSTIYQAKWCAFFKNMAHAQFRRLINVRVLKLITCYLTDTCWPVRSSSSASTFHPRACFLRGSRVRHWNSSTCVKNWTVDEGNFLSQHFPLASTTGRKGERQR